MYKSQHLTILNVFRNYAPNKYITVVQIDPVCIKNSSNVFYKKYIQNGRFESDFVFLENVIAELNELIS